MTYNKHTNQQTTISYVVQRHTMSFYSREKMVGNGVVEEVFGCYIDIDTMIMKLY